MVGASILLVIGRVEPEEVLEKVEWSTIFFFIGLFILVGSLESIGVIDFLANGIVKLTGGNVPVLTFVILWMSAILSSILDNIPYVATMIPLVTHVSNGDVATYESVWWALSIGACLGGTGTIVGASANVVARGIVEKQGFKITFIGYMKIAYPLMLLSILISSIYIFIFYI
jgi:Na+/H+ antiporter NhaD/arsenite permease-like protein